jgi:hypothetical protein
MKTLVAFLLVLSLLAASAAVLAQAGGPGSEQAPTVQAGTVSGGSYQLTSLAWQVSGAVAGGDYALTSPSLPTLRGSGCCCTYLPCVLRGW